MKKICDMSAHDSLNVLENSSNTDFRIYGCQKTILAVLAALSPNHPYIVSINWRMNLSLVAYVTILPLISGRIE